MNKYQQSLVAIAISSAFAAPVFADDNFGATGFTARANALQLDYFSGHKDIGNTLANPALAQQHRNTAILSISNSDRQDLAGNNPQGLPDGQDREPGHRDLDRNVANGGDSNGGAAGALVGVGSSMTAGVLIGRRSDSTAMSDAIQYADNGNGSLAAGSVTGDVDNNVNIQRPKNQFDAFWAMDMGGVDIGLRLNMQGMKEERNLGARTLSTDGVTAKDDMTIEQYVAQRRANAVAGNTLATPPANLQQVVGTFTELTGYTTTGDTPQDFGDAAVEAKETNLNIGFNLKSLGIDGAVQIGKASGKQSRTTAESGRTVEYVASGNTDINRQLSQFSTTSSDTLDIDGGDTLGIALRGQVGKSTTVSLGLIDQEYSGSLSGVSQTSESSNLLFASATSTTATQTATFTETLQFSGSRTNKQKSQSIKVAHVLNPAANSALTIVSGIDMFKNTGGSTLTRVAATNTYTESDDSATVGVNEAYTETFYTGTYGPMSTTTSESKGTMIPLIIALEHGIDANWTARGSVSKNLYESTKSTQTTTRYATAAGQARAITLADGSPTTGPDTSYVVSSTTNGRKSAWADYETTIRMGFGYTAGNISVDAVLSATLDRLFTSDHKILEDSKFGNVTLTYKW